MKFITIILNYLGLCVNHSMYEIARSITNAFPKKNEIMAFEWGSELPVVK